MSKNRLSDIRTERAAVLAVEQSLLSVEGMWVAEPRSDLGVDLLIYRENPFAAASVQVKGQSTGLTVWNKHSSSSLIMAYVLGPRGGASKIFLLTGEEAWNLPETYKAHGGRASDYHAGLASYRWSGVTTLLSAVLESFEACPRRWAELFDIVSARDLA